MSCRMKEWYFVSRELCNRNNATSLTFQDYDSSDLADFEDTIMKGCDFNRDGKISKKELTMILLALSKQAGEE